MRRIATVAIVLLGASVTAAALAASASAELPEYMSCQRVAKTGRYETNACSEENPGGKGKFELVKGFKGAGFTSKAGRTRLESVEIPEPMECKSTKLSGELTGAKEEKDIVATFTGCEAVGAKCTSAGAEAGTIVSNPLHGELGYLSGKGTSSPVVGVLLMAQETTYSSEFACEGLAVRIRGALIAEVSGDINAISSKSSYAFRQSGGLPQYTFFEGGTFLEHAWRWEFNRGGGFEPEGGNPSGLEVTAPVASEPVEIRA